MTTPSKPAAKPKLVLSKIATIRRDNLRTLCDIHGAAALARRLGYRTASFMSQMAGPNPSREVTEKSAREIEQVLELKPGTMDIEGWDPTLAPQQPVAETPVDPTSNTAVITDVLRLIGKVSEDEHVTVPPLKLPDMVAMTFADAMDRGGVPRESFVKQLVHLLK